MSKRQRKHNHVVSSVLAAALAFTAIVSSAQLASVSDQLAANVSGKYVATATCPDGSPMPAGGTCPMAGGGGETGTFSCMSLGGFQATKAQCDAADAAKASCTASGGTWSGSGTSASCTAGGGGATNTCPTGQWMCSNGQCSVNSVCPTTTTNTCPFGQYWDTTTSACKTSQTCPTGQYWDTATNVCKTSTTNQTCPTGQYWDSATNVCKTSTTNQTCPTGQYWDTATNVCKTSTTNQTCSGTTSYKWGDGTCHGTQEIIGNCTAGEVWNPDNSICMTNACSGTTSVMCSNGTCVANQSSCPTTTTQTCPSGKYWNGTACTSSTGTTATACGYNQYWDGTACVPYTTTQPTTYKDFFAGPQCSKTAAHIDAYCFGFNQWNDQAGCVSYDENADGKGDYEWHSDKSDCFPKFGGGMMGPMTPPPMPFGGKMIPGVTTTQNAGADFTQWMKVSTTEADAQDYCLTTTGRNDPGCAFQRLKGTESTTDIYSMIKAQAETFGTSTGPDAADFAKFGEVDQMFDRMRFETGGAYCPEMEQLGKVLYEAEANEDLAIIEAVAADADTYMEQLQGCGDVNRFHELTELRSKVDELPDSDGKADLLAKINEVSADPDALSNPRKMGDLWKAYGILNRGFEQNMADEGPCNSIERTKRDIEDYLAGEHDVEFSGEAPSREVVERVLEDIETTLAEANEVGGPEGKKMCKLMKEELKKMERKYFGNQGVFHDPVEDYMMNLYGDANYIDSQTMMYEGLEGFDIEGVKAFITQTIMEQFARMKDEIIVQLRAEFKTALTNSIDWEARILDNQYFSGAATAVSDVTDSLSEVFGSEEAEVLQEAATERLAADLEQLPTELAEGIYDRQEEVLTELFQPILAADPEVLEEVQEPLQELLGTCLSEPLPEGIAGELIDYHLVGTLTNALEVSGVPNEDGKYIIENEDDREVVVEILRDVLAEAQEIVESGRLEAAQVEEGLKVDFPDIEGDEWYATALLGRITDGSTKGEGDGTANADGLLLKAHVAVQMDRTLESNASTTLLGDQASRMDAWMHEGAAFAAEAGAVDASRAAAEMAEPATRGDAIFMMARMLGSEESEIADIIDQLPCTLDEDDLSDTSCSMEHADEINFAVNAGIVRGQESAGGTLSLAADSNVNRAESWTMQGRMETFLTEVEAVGADVVLDRMEEAIGNPDSD